MKVTFFDYGTQLASSRLRSKIPAAELQKLGVGEGNDILIAGKHFFNLGQRGKYGRFVFDVCDDHFDGRFGHFYLEACATADAITCNSPTMQDIIFKHTDRLAFVIPDPYESEEIKPDMPGESVLWFGHSSNYFDAAPVLKRIDRPIEIVSNLDTAWCRPWSQEEMAKAFAKIGVVVIPTNEKIGKSNNRLVASLRAGRYVVTGPLPAYDEFKDFATVCNKNYEIIHGVERAFADKEGCLNKIRAGQDYIRDRYSPETIGKRWLDVLSQVLNLKTCMV